MTEEKMNAAIAEACPDKFRNENDVWFFQFAKDCWSQCHNNSICSDLNAIHEAEQFLWRRDYTLRKRFVEKLAAILNKSEWRKMEAVDMLDLTARERAEAFLRTLGKWEEVRK